MKQSVLPGGTDRDRWTSNYKASSPPPSLTYTHKRQHRKTLELNRSHFSIIINLTDVLGASSPPEHEFGVFVLHVFVHQLQQQRPHDVRIILQFAVQRHRQQGGEVTPSSGVEVRAALQRADELEAENAEVLNQKTNTSEKVHS